METHSVSIPAQDPTSSKSRRNRCRNKGSFNKEQSSTPPPVSMPSMNMPLETMVAVTRSDQTGEGGFANSLLSTISSMPKNEGTSIPLGSSGAEASLSSDPTATAKKRRRRGKKQSNKLNETEALDQPPADEFILMQPTTIILSAPLMVMDDHDDQTHLRSSTIGSSGAEAPLSSDLTASSASSNNVKSRSFKRREKKKGSVSDSVPTEKTGGIVSSSSVTTSGGVTTTFGNELHISPPQNGQAAATSSGLSPLLLWSRQENSLNQASEENHSNRQNEQHLRQQAQQETQAVVAQNVALEESKKNSIEKKLKVTEPVKSLANNDSGGTDASLKEAVASSKDGVASLRDGVASSADEGAKMAKAKLKAERKAAFEASQKIALIQKNLQTSEVKEKETIPLKTEAGKNQNETEPNVKSKSQLKAERRALQEAQRAAKIEVSKPGVVESKVVAETTALKTDPINSAPLEKKSLTRSSPSPLKKSVRKLRLFSHLPQHCWKKDLTSELGLSGAVIHPAVIRVGLRMAQGLIRGSNARCVATLAALKQVIEEYQTPPQKELSRDLDASLTPHVQFLSTCRPPSASMLNAVKRLRWEISQIASDTTDEQAKSILCLAINRFIEEDVLLAKKAVSECAGKKIAHGDVILTYGCSSLVKQVLVDAHLAGKKFRVIVVDSRPALEGRSLLLALTGQGISCTYIWINAVSYVIKEVTKVMLGCHSLQANGYVMSRVGSSQVSLVAHASNVPVLVCCETYKFCERVHTDAFVYNELGDPNDLVLGLPPSKDASLSNWTSIGSLNLVNLTYDVMPAHLVTSIITELQMLPCTSVPVVLRVKHHTAHEL